MLPGREPANLTVVTIELGLRDGEVFFVRVDDKREREPE